MQLIAPQEAARRARAAIAYAGMDLDDLAAETGITKGTLRNITSKTRPQGAKLERLYAIADACSVPRAFMDNGFAAQPTVSELGERVAELERQLASPRPAPDPGETIERELEGAVRSSQRQADNNEQVDPARHQGGQGR